MARIKAKEGHVYALPRFSKIDWHVLITRSNGKGGLLGYFYPKLEQVGVAPPKFIGLVGDLGIRNGEWRQETVASGWKREDWPIPRFRRLAPGEQPSDETRIVTYDDDLAGIGREQILAGSFEELPLDGAYGYKAVEVPLKRLE